MEANDPNYFNMNPPKAFLLANCEECSVYFLGSFRGSCSVFEPTALERLRANVRNNFDGSAFCPQCGILCPTADSFYFLKSEFERRYYAGSGILPPDEVIVKLERLLTAYSNSRDKKVSAKLREQATELLDFLPDLMDLIDIGGDFSIPWSISLHAILFAIKAIKRRSNTPANEIFERELLRQLEKVGKNKSSA